MYRLHTATDTAIRQGTSKYRVVREIAGNFGYQIIDDNLLNDPDVQKVIKNPENQRGLARVWFTLIYR